jgi:D-alanine-D-alanine ligase
MMALIEREKPLVAFNLVEHLRWDRLLSPNVPSLLELLGVPFTGCSNVGMSIALDKAASKQILREHGVTAPRFRIIPDGARAGDARLEYPIIVKPRFGGGSEGISRASLVRNRRELAARVRRVHSRFRQPAICEEFIEGREFSVGIIGNGSSAFALPVRETIFGLANRGGPSFATEMLKRSQDYRDRWRISYCKAAIDRRLEDDIIRFCIRAYNALELCGYARIDLRQAADGRLFFLEANPNPDLSPRVFGVMASWIGLGYGDLLQSIIESALQRRRGRR